MWKPVPPPTLAAALASFLIAALAAAASSPAGEPDPAEFNSIEYQVYKAWKAGDHAAALAGAEKLLALDPGNGDALYNIAALHALLGHKDEASSWLKKAAQDGGMRSYRMARQEAYLRMLERPDRDSFQRPEEVMAALAFKPGERVADIGAGSGYFTIRAAKAVGPSGVVRALDIEPMMVDYVAKRARDAGLANVKPALVPAEDPGLPPGGIDTILMVDTWHYVTNRAEYAKKLRAALAPGGRVVIIDYIPKPFEVRPWGPLPHQQYPKEMVDAEMAAAGLTPVRVHGFLAEQYFVEYGVK